MTRLDRIKALRAQDYGVASLSPADIDWLIEKATPPLGLSVLLRQQAAGYQAMGFEATARMYLDYAGRLENGD